jgi:hypothetical protein
MSAALGLYRLQIVDSQMDEIRARLEKIRQILENDQEMQKAKKQVSETEATRQRSQHSLKQAEAEVDKQKIKIAQSEARLYSGNVKNPKELQDLQNEVAALKRHLETLEDRQLEAMLEEESTEQAHQAAIEKMERVKARLADQNKTLTSEQSNLNKDLERLDAERSAALSPLDPSLLTVYDHLRKEKRGLAIATVSEGACAACGTTLTPAQLQSVRSTAQITHCPTCGRILYAN